MPELPEVETVARQLAPLIVGRTIKAAHVFDPLLLRQPLPPLLERRIVAVARRGKQVVIEFDGAPLALAVHLRMTGRLVYSEQDDGAEGPPLRARFGLDRGELRFLDTRRFGTFTWVDDLRLVEPAGVEPLGPQFTTARLQELLAGSTTPLKVWLLRQEKIVGIGNIYASEILYKAKLDPFRPAGTLLPREIGALRRATIAVLERAIGHSGTTFSDFQDAHGLTGSYQRYLAVYDREGKPCRRCARPIERVVQAQRSTYFCRNCVKRSRPIQRRAPR